MKRLYHLVENKSYESNSQKQYEEKKMDLTVIEIKRIRCQKKKQLHKQKEDPTYLRTEIWSTLWVIEYVLIYTSHHISSKSFVQQMS